ncbi:MAG: hypothetical protein ABIF87_06570 [Pseudomonadota bacterium]
MNILAEIPARGGSKGVPRKALQKIGDIPLIAYTIRDALTIKGITKVIVNTDDPMIRDVSIQYGAEVPFLRPAKLAGDNSDIGHTIVYSRQWLQKHEGFKPDVYIIMSPTNPFRRKNIINDSLQKALADESIFNVGSVAPANIMVDNYWIKRNGKMQRFKIPLNGKPTSTILYQSAFSFNIVFDCRTNLPNRRIAVILNEIESIDIDEPEDLEIARMVIKEGLYPFDE